MAFENLTFEALNGSSLNLNDDVLFRLEEMTMTFGGKRYQWAQGADSDGAVLADRPRFENGTVELRVRVKEGSSMSLALSRLGLIVERLEEASRLKRGIKLSWTPADGLNTNVLRVLAGDVTGMPIVPGGQDSGWFRASPIITIRLTCEPFIYGDPVSLGTDTSTDPYIEATIESSGIAGDAPAEVTVVIADDASEDRRFVELGVGRLEEAGGNSPVLVDADELDTSGYRGALSTHDGVTTVSAATWGWSSLCAIRSSTPANPYTYVGTYRVKARMAATDASSGARQRLVRLAWSANSGPLRRNDPAILTEGGEWWELDLGLITVPDQDLGDPLFFGVIEIFTDVLEETFDLHYLTFIPAEQFAVISSDVEPAVPAVVGYDIVHTSDTTSGGTLNDRVFGAGTWASDGVSAATDWEAVLSTKAHGIQFARGLSYGAQGNQFAWSTFQTSAGSIADTDVSALTFMNVVSEGAGTAEFGVAARFQPGVMGIGDHVGCWLGRSSGGTGGTAYLRLTETVAASQTILATRDLPDVDVTVPHRLRLIVYETGHVIGLLYQYTGSGANESLLARVDAFDPTTLGTGGAIDEGYAGVLDRGSGAGTIDRAWGEFSFGHPGPEQLVINSGGSIVIGSYDCLREDSSGTFWGPPPKYQGARPTLHHAGAAEARNRVVAKARRQDSLTSPDAGTADSTTMEIIYTPRYLVPR